MTVSTRQMTLDSGYEYTMVRLRGPMKRHNTRPC